MNRRFSCNLDRQEREALHSGVFHDPSMADDWENGRWGTAVLELGYTDIELNLCVLGGLVEPTPSPEYFICLNDVMDSVNTGLNGWYSEGYLDEYIPGKAARPSVDWLAEDWEDQLRKDMEAKLELYLRTQGIEPSQPVLSGTKRVLFRTPGDVAWDVVIDRLTRGSDL